MSVPPALDALALATALATPLGVIPELARRWLRWRGSHSIPTAAWFLGERKRGETLVLSTLGERRSQPGYIRDATISERWEHEHEGGWDDHVNRSWVICSVGCLIASGALAGFVAFRGDLNPTHTFWSVALGLLVVLAVWSEATWTWTQCEETFFWLLLLPALTGVMCVAVHAFQPSGIPSPSILLVILALASALPPFAMSALLARSVAALIIAATAYWVCLVLRWASPGKDRHDGDDKRKDANLELEHAVDEIMKELTASGITALKFELEIALNLPAQKHLDTPQLREEIMKKLACGEGRESRYIVQLTDEIMNKLARGADWAGKRIMSPQLEEMEVKRTASSIYAGKSWVWPQEDAPNRWIDSVERWLLGSNCRSFLAEGLLDLPQSRRSDLPFIAASFSNLASALEQGDRDFDAWHAELPALARGADAVFGFLVAGRLRPHLGESVTWDRAVLWAVFLVLCVFVGLVVAPIAEFVWTDWSQKSR